MIGFTFFLRGAALGMAERQFRLPKEESEGIEVLPELRSYGTYYGLVPNILCVIIRLVLDAGKAPLVLPFVHSGMQEVMPIGSKFPSIRKRVDFLKHIYGESYSMVYCIVRAYV